jgi:hypothetical protein
MVTLEELEDYMDYDSVKNSIDDKDLIIGTEKNSVIYRADEVDSDEYHMLKKIYDKETIKIPQDEERLMNSFIDKDTKKDRIALKHRKQALKNWIEKIEPWMKDILKI